jgi:hypothetical protein
MLPVVKLSLQYMNSNSQEGVAVGRNSKSGAVGDEVLYNLGRRKARMRVSVE